MLEKEKMERLNYLARKAKQEKLGSAELAEQKLLREEYLAKFRVHFRDHLDRIKFVEDEQEGPERVEKKIIN